MRNTFTAIFVLLAGTLSLAACSNNDGNGGTRDLSMPGGGDEGDMSVGGDNGDMRMQLPPDMTKVDQIQAVKNAADSSGTDGGALDLPLANVIVTYLHPAIGSDPAGFFVQ